MNDGFPLCNAPIDVLRASIWTVGCPIWVELKQVGFARRLVEISAGGRSGQLKLCRKSKLERRRVLKIYWTEVRAERENGEECGWAGGRIMSKGRGHMATATKIW